MKKVSIIVPVYNTADYLPKCIESIIKQRYINIELILVDDGSTDKSPIICDEYSEKDKRIKVVHKQNGGVSSARNCGLDIATGDYVTFVDSDDCILSSFSDFCEKLDQQDLVISYSEKTNKNIIKKIKKVQSKERDVIINFLIKNSAKLETNIVWNKIFNQQIIKMIRFNEKVMVAEDMDFVLRALLSCQKIEFIPNDYYVYYQRETSVMHDNSYNAVKKVVDSGNELISYYSKEFNSGKWHKRIIALISENIMSGIFIRYKGSNQENKNKILVFVRENIKQFSYVKNFYKRVFYIIIRVFGIKFALNLYCQIKK